MTFVIQASPAMTIVPFIMTFVKQASPTMTIVPFNNVRFNITEINI